MQSWRGRTGMVVIREISENWRRLFADLIQPPNTSTQMAGRRGLRAASCSTRRDPSLRGSPNTSQSIPFVWCKMVGKGLGRWTGGQED